MAKTPTAFEVGQAAELLGVDLFDLGHALREFSAYRFKREADKVRGYEDPNFGDARRLLRAARACENAWEEEKAAVEA